MASGPESWLPRLHSTRIIRELMRAYYEDLGAASEKGEGRIAWCSSQGPVEMLRAMGFRVYFPENHGALLGTTRRAMECIGYANAAGYAPDICSYLTSDIGAFLSDQTPLREAYGLARPPRPDVLVYNNNQCRDVQEWFSFYGRRYDVPVLGIRTPRGVGEVNEGVIQGVVQQMKNMALELARISGRPLDPAAFRETVSFSAQTSRLWREVLETAAHRPAPISFGDMCIHIGPAVVLRGLPVAVNYYRQLLSELRTRIREGRGAVPGELFRVYWEGMPIWGRLRWLAESLAEMGIAGVASTYGHSWIYDAFDPEDPFTSTARGYTALFTVRDESYKESFLKEMLSRFQVDGIIFHHSRTCPSCTNSLYGMPRRLTERTGIPHLLLDGDLNDLRCFSQEQALTNLEAFAELLAQRKTGQAA